MVVVVLAVFLFLQKHLVVPLRLLKRVRRDGVLVHCGEEAVQGKESVVQPTPRAPSRRPA